MEKSIHEDYYEEEEEDTPQSLFLQKGDGRWNRKEMAYMIGAGVLIMVILIIALWPEGDAEDLSLDPGSVGAISVRFDAVDQRLMEIETRLNRVPESNEQINGIDDLANRSIENSQRVEQILARLQTLDRRVAELHKAVEKSRTVVQTTPASAQTRSQSADRRYYEVKKGDTPYSIARKNGMALKALLELNGMNSNAVIHPGDRIRIQ